MKRIYYFKNFISSKNKVCDIELRKGQMLQIKVNNKNENKNIQLRAFLTFGHKGW